MGLLPAKKILLAVLSGLLITASFPPLKTGWLIWISIIPLLVAIRDTPPRTAFKLGVITGLSHYVSLIYWIINVLSTYGGLNILVSILVLILLSLYLALYVGAFASLVSYCRRSSIKIFLFAGIWVSLEYIRTFIFTGFPWGLLGYSLYDILSIAQIASVTGVYGLSFIIAAFNVLIFQLIIKHKEIIRDRYFFIEALSLLILTGASIIYGHRYLAAYPSEKPENQQVNIAIIQGNIDQTVKWDVDFIDATMEKYIELSRRSLDRKPDIIVWPETAVPLFFQDENPYTEELYDLTGESGASLVFGSPSYRIEGDTVRYYNTAWCISPEGTIKGQYDKNHLVPFGEYVPFQEFLPFVHRLVPAAGDFTSGDSTDPIKIGEIPSGILICYEVIFPDIARDQVLKGARILINITNDAWFGFSGAPYQHLYMSVFRAIENRRPLIRSANTGISAIIDSTGHIKKQGDIFTEEIITGKIQAGNDALSFYSRYGDIFAIGIFILCLITIFIELCYSKKNRINKSKDT